MVREGRLSAAANMLTSAGMAPPTEETLQCLRDKHPHDALPRIPDPVPNSRVLRVGVPALMSALRSFPRGSAPGPSKLRVQHLLDACRVPGHRCAEAVARLVEVCLEGHVPPFIRPHLCGAALIAQDRPMCGRSQWEKRCGA
jgi:hypothetical protein